MINLLPYDQKKQLLAARTNTRLLRYNLMLVLAVVFLAAATVFVYTFLSRIEMTATEAIAANQAQERSYSDVKARAQAFQAQLGDAQTIFGSELSYSRALVRYADLFPEGTAIGEMNLAAENFTAPTTVPVQVTGEEATDRLVESMENSPYVSGFSYDVTTINDDSDFQYTLDVTFTLSQEIAK